MKISIKSVKDAVKDTAKDAKKLTKQIQETKQLQGISKVVQSGVDQASKVASDVKNSKIVSDIGNTVQSATDQATKVAENVAQSKPVKNISDTVKTAKDQAVKAVEDANIMEHITSAFSKEEEELEPKTISNKNALKIFYYFMNIDGKITGDELECFNEIGRSFDVHFDDKKKKIIEECDENMSDNDSDRIEGINELAETCAVLSVSDSMITPKQLVWNLLTLAYSDDDYVKEEQDFIRRLALKFNISDSSYLELESSIKTLEALAQEEYWIKRTDRPYMVIEEIVNEIEDRKSKVFNSVKELIALEEV